MKITLDATHEYLNLLHWLSDHPQYRPRIHISLRHTYDELAPGYYEITFDDDALYTLYILSKPRDLGCL